MKNRTLILVLLLASATALAQTAPNPLAAAGWFASLAGACWRGEHPTGKSSDTQCYETQYGRYIRGTIKVQDDKGTLLTEGDSVFAPDPKLGRIVYSQWASNGSYGTGEMRIDGPVLRFQHRQPEGAESRIRFTWSRLDADSFRVSRERRLDDGAWKEEFGVVYRRVP
jgi:hypothetical protein